MQGGRRARQKEGAFVVEGVRLAEEALASSWAAKLVLHSKDLSVRGQDVVRGFADLEVPVLGGTATAKAKANTQTGETVRLKGKGIVEAGGRRHGDHYVHFRVVTPKKLSREQKKLFEELARTLSNE